MQPDNEIKIILASDFAHEKIVAEIYYRDRFVALVSQDTREQFLVEFPGAEALEDQVVRAIPLGVLQNALALAIGRLTQPSSSSSV